MTDRSASFRSPLSRIPLFGRWLGRPPTDLTQLDDLVADLETQIATLGQHLDRLEREIDSELASTIEHARTEYRAAMERATKDYEAVAGGVRRTLREIERGAGLWGADWSDRRWLKYRPSNRPPSVVRIGTLDCPGRYESLTAPALVPFIGGRSLLISSRRGADVSVAGAIRSYLLRALATLPPGKARLLMIDPVGHGASLASFMQLRDHDPELVTGKIWSEARDIDQRLADVTSHMETVHQTYLRGQFESIERYNDQAGEVAESYRFVVALDFPVRFSTETARRLASICANGPKCGVFAIVVADTAQSMPRGFELREIQASCTHIEGGEDSSSWTLGGFDACALTLDQPPPVEVSRRLLDQVGGAAQEASVVQVPFSRVAPDADEYWKSDSGEGLTCPLGRAGARKLLTLELGKGTAQHLLIAGRTGSGKSTLLHVMITNLALRYAPDQLDFYLIDFKKGVEFKDYAIAGLPHARAIAIESEREFGLSVLRRLDAELTDRGQRFRASRAQDLAAHRARSGERMPRILLLVDEFQEFFTDDDKLAREASLLLDRLTRQGRSFGIHVVLGSQTLAGAYTLARTTVDQMAVRVALQCSEADSRLILADDNPAARLLVRPGEAFYNDQAGAKEANTRFQVAWQHADERRQVLGTIRDMDTESSHVPTVVFEGGAPADLIADPDHPLIHGLRARQPVESGTPCRLWLGEPVAIEPPIATEFDQQPGRNLLVVGRDADMARGLLLCTVLSTIAFSKANAAHHIFDFAGLLRKPAEYEPALRRLTAGKPFKRLNALTATLRGLHADVETRCREADDDGSAEFSPIWLFLLGVHRARDLRQDDAPAYRRDGDELGPAKLLEGIMRSGPEVAVHTVVWAETYQAAEATIGRRLLPEFGARVVMTVDGRASADLIGGPDAAKLGAHRAILSDDQLVGELRKFRPYQALTAEWIAANCDTP